VESDWLWNSCDVHRYHVMKVQENFNEQWSPKDATLCLRFLKNLVKSQASTPFSRGERIILNATVVAATCDGDANVAKARSELASLISRLMEIVKRKKRDDEEKFADCKVEKHGVSFAPPWATHLKGACILFNEAATCLLEEAVAELKAIVKDLAKHD
jgi:hypothetical protein